MRPVCAGTKGKDKSRQLVINNRNGYGVIQITLNNPHRERAMAHAEHLYPVPVEEPNAPEDWLEPYRQVRAVTERLCSPLETEDYVIQSMNDVSPPKWHLAHVTWFFETFLLKPYLRGYVPLNDAFDHLFNSYYETHGEPFPRPQRGVLSRPTVSEVYRYRHYVDEAMGLSNSTIAEELSLPPVKIHCSVLAEDAIKAAISDYKKKKGQE